MTCKEPDSLAAPGWRQKDALSLPEHQVPLPAKGGLPALSMWATKPLENYRELPRGAPGYGSPDDYQATAAAILLCLEIRKG